MINEIKIIKNFLSQEEIDDLINEAKSKDSLWEYRDTQVKVWIIKTKQFSLIKKIKKRIDSFFEPNLYTQIIKHINKSTSETLWPEHYDSEASKNVKYGIIIYLNDDFEGGDLIYKKLNYVYTPKAGDMVIHPASEMYSHEVSQVVSGERYTLTSFVWEQNKNGL